MRKRLLILIVSILIFQHGDLFSQQVSFAPVFYKTDKGNFGFLGVTQDRLGNIWLSSYDAGIFRYDGSGFTNFQHNDTVTNSLASDHAECIYADSSDIVWVGTFNAGLDRYDPLTNQFTHYRHNDRDAASLANDTVTAILKDREGNLWIGTYGGLDLFDPKNGHFKHFSHDPKNKSGISSNSVRSIYEDRQGTLWVGCGRVFSNDGAEKEEGGLNRFDREKGSFTQYMHEPGNPNSLETNKVKALFEDSRGNFWVGTSGNGLHIMDREKGTFTHYYYDSTHPEKLSRPPYNGFDAEHITFINEDNAGAIWIGSYLAGINRYDTATQKISHFGKALLGVNYLRAVAADTSYGYSDWETWQAYFSPDGQIWFTALRPHIGTAFYHASIVSKSIPFYPVGKMGGSNTFYSDSDSLLWIGTDSGLIKKNLFLHTEKIYQPEPGNPNSLSNKSVYVIRVDKEKNFWIGTNHGLNKFDPLTNHFTHFQFNAKIESSLSNDTILSMFIDHAGDLWVGTNDGLNKMDRKSERFTHFKLENRRKINFGNWVNCIREDQNGQLWVATQGGLYRVDIRTGTVTTVLPTSDTRSICVDSKNVVWIGCDITSTSNKQNLYRLMQGHFVLFADPNRQEAITGVFDIMEDRQRNLWVSTTNAIIRVNEQRDVVKRFGSEYGVHKSNFGTGDNFQTAYGRLYFGDGLGYYSFLPADLTSNSQPLLNFTSFRLDGKEIVPAEHGILQKPIWRTDEIRLAHNENNFSFEFTGIDYQSSGVMKYLFMLENYDNDWQTYGNGHRAIYFNLPPGTYTMKVKAVIPDGSMSEKSMRIIISPPWWKSWWAYTIFAFLIFGSIRGFILYRSRKLLAENKLLEEKVSQRTEQLNLSLKELKSTQNQLIQSEKMASLGELTAGIAHEIQNPLNFVNNFSEINSELIAEMKEEIVKGNMEEIQTLADHIEDNEKKIVHHGKRADAIVKGMLQHSRTSNAVKELTDLNKLVDEYLRLSYHGLRAKDKSFNADFQTNYDLSIGKINIIPQDIGRVLLNLFNNAFYAVAEKKQQQPDGYHPTVCVSTVLMSDQVEIKVSDNGNGISQKILDKIFQPFFTTKPTGQGTGLGLSLSYDIIKAHGGVLKVETNEEGGAVFVIQIPVA